MKLTKIKGILESTFTDEMDITRYVKITDPDDGTTRMELSETPI